MISVESAFNAFGIYKLNSLKNSKYNADYFCKICNGKNYGCIEDNDHVGLHNQMISNKYKLFINKQIIIHFKKNNYITYSNFIENIRNTNNIAKNPLIYTLKKKYIDTNFYWLTFSNKIEKNENIISNYCNKDIFSFSICKNNDFSDSFINKNIIKYVGNLYININKFINDHKD